MRQKPALYWCALLGLRIDLADVTHAGLPVLSLVLFTMVATICIGYLVSRSLGQTKGFSFIIGGSVAICGVSAAAALCAFMEECKTRDQELAITVAGITVLSTLVMLFYPVISQAIGLNDMAAGTLMGGSIHNVSQAVGSELATVALVVSLVAIGIKTDLKQVASVGVKPLIAMSITTVAMAAIVLAGIFILSI